MNEDEMLVFLRKLSALIVGLALVAGVVWLAFKAAENQSYILWYGLATAFVAPISLEIIKYIFAPNDQAVLKRLAKVPEIEKMINDAQTQEEKIRLLEQERLQLADIIRFESTKQALIYQKSELEKQAVNTLSQLEAIDTEFSDLNIPANAGPSIEEIRKLQNRVQSRLNGDIIFRIGKRHIILDKRMFSGFLGGDFLYSSLRFMNNRKIKRVEEKGKNKP